MSKRKPAPPKHNRRPKIAAKAHVSAQAVVRSPKDRRLRSASTKTPRKRHNELNQVARVIDNPSTAFQGNSTKTTAPRHERPSDFNQPAPVIESSELDFRDDYKRKNTDDSSKKDLNSSSATENVQTYQAKLLEMVQANMQFAFEFGQRLATITSPVEFPSVIAELTKKRIAIFQKHSKEMVEVSSELYLSGLTRPTFLRRPGSN